MYWMALLLPGVALSQIFMGMTLPDTADGIFHTHRIYAMNQLMQSGDLYPRWVPWFHLGYGYPVFNYYAPLATWVGGLLGLVGISAPLAFQLVTATSWLAGSLGMTALARRFLPDAAALAAAALWVYAPARMHEYWIQGSLSHIVATALVPWVLLTLVNVIKHPARRETLAFGTAVGLLILAHQPTTYLTGLYAAGTGAALLAWRVYRRQGQLLRIIVHTGLGLLIALGLAAVLLLPLLFEIDAIVINDTPSGNIPALLETNAVPLGELFVQPQPLDHTDLNATIPHTYGLFSGVLALAGIAALLLRRRYALALLLAVGAGLSILLATPASLDVWHRLPLMDQLRFPWRVLRVGIAPLSLLAAASVRLLPGRWLGYASAGVIALAILSALPTIYPTGRVVDFSGQTAADMIRYESGYNAPGGTSYNEFKPAWGERTPDDLPENLAAYETNPLQLHIAEQSGIQTQRQSGNCWLVSAESGEELDLRQFYFPGWQATLDGQPLPVEAEPTYGLLRIPLPQTQNAALCVNYTGTTLQRGAGWLTVMVGVVVAGLWLADRGQHARHSAQSTLSPRWAYAVSGGLIAGALINGLWIGPRTHLFRLQSTPDRPHNMQVPLRASFMHGYDLLGYSLHDQTAAPGGTLSLTLFWRPQTAVDGEHYAPVVQLTNLRGTRAWASSELPYIGSSPYNHTPQHYISQRVDLRIFDDAPPFVGQITVRLMDQRADMWLSLVGDAGDHITLPDVIPITGTSTQPVTLNQPYVIAGAITLIDANIQRENDTLVVDLVWQIQQPLAQDSVKLFIHALDASGSIVHQLDVAPFGDDYPARYWRSGQILAETYHLPAGNSVARVAVGMYTPQNRLPVTSSGEPVPEDRILFDVP